MSQNESLWIVYLFLFTHCRLLSCFVRRDQLRFDPWSTTHRPYKNIGQQSRSNARRYIQFSFGQSDTVRSGDGFDFVFEKWAWICSMERHSRRTQLHRYHAVQFTRVHQLEGLLYNFMTAYYFTPNCYNSLNFILLRRDIWPALLHLTTIILDSKSCSPTLISPYFLASMPLLGPANCNFLIACKMQRVNMLLWCRLRAASVGKKLHNSQFTLKY